jgi:hypothetical protein
MSRGRLPVPTVRFTIYYQGETALPLGTPRNAEWIPDPESYSGMRLYVAGAIYLDPEEWLAAIQALRAGNFPDPPSFENSVDPMAAIEAAENDPEELRCRAEQVAALNREFAETFKA